MAEIGDVACVRVTLAYQSLPSYYLRAVFASSAGEHSETLFHLIGRTKTEGTPIEYWKITITEAEAPVPR